MYIKIIIIKCEHIINNKVEIYINKNLYEYI